MSFSGSEADGSLCAVNEAPFNPRRYWKNRYTCGVNKRVRHALASAKLAFGHRGYPCAMMAYKGEIGLLASQQSRSLVPKSVLLKNDPAWLNSYQSNLPKI
jgi:hypothetical protein